MDLTQTIGSLPDVRFLASTARCHSSRGEVMPEGPCAARSGARCHVLNLLPVCPSMHACTMVHCSW